MSLRTGSLCSGYCGLDGGVHAVLGGDLAWVADTDPGAAAVLAHRFPSAPNLGDISQIDWDSVEPVEILTAGFPCQDVSCAGARQGLRAGTRTGVWAHVAEAIGVLRPSLVLLENVRGLLSAGADSDMEPCPWCLGETGDEHALRAAGAVLGDLAGLGFDAEWTTLPASAAGAPHRRERVFILAWPAADAERGAGGQPDGHAAERGRQGEAEQARVGDQHAASDADSSGRGTGEPDLRTGKPDAGRGALADADSCGFQELAECDGRTITGVDRALRHDALGHLLDWGPYGAAVEQWERTLGRPAPRPTVPGKTAERLNPVFVEWMQGLPEGWVTDVPGLSRNAMLKALGNGVVPQQAELALRILLARAFPVPAEAESAA